HSKKEYLEKVENVKPNITQKRIIEFCETKGINRIFSIGSGIASLEYCLKKLSKIPVIVSDYDSSICRLKEFKIFDDVLQIDALNDILPIDENTLVIFARIDTEFEDESLKLIFQKCKIAGVKYIWFIPAELINIRILLAEFKIFLICKLLNKKRVFCGYARTKKAFINLWSEFYKIETEFKKINRSFFLKYR
ncbi:MAG: hypothetical protein WCG95_02995, partial [bacterium]